LCRNAAVGAGGQTGTEAWRRQRPTLNNQAASKMLGLQCLIYVLVVVRLAVIYSLEHDLPNPAKKFAFSWGLSGDDGVEQQQQHDEDVSRGRRAGEHACKQLFACLLASMGDGTPREQIERGRRRRRRQDHE